MVSSGQGELRAIGTEHVLCLYFKDDSRKHELAERQKSEYPDVKYRYWKSDAATLKGKYSEEFLGKLGRAERGYFTSDKEPRSPSND
jgi:hypothetical protein